MDAKKIVEQVQGIYGGRINHGLLRLTEFHLVWCVPIEQRSDTESAITTVPKYRERYIPFPMLSYCSSRPVPPTSGQSPSIRIRCRDFTFVTFNFNDNDIMKDVYEFIKSRTCKLGSVEKLYAFSHKPLKHEKDVNGWHFYDPRAEFRRQGISEKLPDRGWRITNINHDFSFCETYPAVMVVPSKISDNVLKYAREFRSRNRIPALSYIHPVNNCTITRSSQPKAGLTRRTNVQDEKLVAASFSALLPPGSEDSTPPTSQPDMASGTPPIEPELGEKEKFEDEFISNNVVMFDEKTGKRLVYGAQQSNLIVDARPTINAMVNQVQGLGSENMDKYRFARKIFLNIANIHVMRSSLNKIVDALKDTDISPLSPSQELLHHSGWLKHIHDVLDGSAIIARQVGINHSNVLIHCSDGWDRTSQLSALAQVMLDPFFRTIEGFVVLVEKDWLSFGHMFRLRSGHLNHEDWFTVQKDAFAGSKVQPGENDGRTDAFQTVLSGAKRFFNQNAKDDPDLATISEVATGKPENDEGTAPKMVSPVFHQFLDCMYQLLRQHPTRFEYNERFLRRLLYSLHSCQYGTFLFNSEKQRHDARAKERTLSVWDDFLGRKAEFTNPEFDPAVNDHVKGQERILFPRLKEIRWWYRLFDRTDKEMNGAIDAAALAEQDRLNAVNNLQYPSTVQTDPAPRSETSTPHPPGLATSQSVLTAVESSDQILTAEDKKTSLRRSASAERPNPAIATSHGISDLSNEKRAINDPNPASSNESSTTLAVNNNNQEPQEMT